MTMMKENQDQKYMQMALELAGEAAECGEIPVGALIVQNDRVIAKAHNLRETKRLATAHAELLAVEEACRVLSQKWLSDCTLYVTLEPCPMCMGAIVNSRIKRVVFGAKDSKAGSCGSVFNFNDYPLNHKPEIIGGIMEDEGRALLSDFFAEKRKNK